MASSDPRAYGSGVEKAFYRLSRGTCYFPDCANRIFEVVDGEPVVAVDIAHIHGANAGSARYRPEMTTEHRRAFENLILLCRAHHKTVDGRRREEFPAELLKQWKQDNEPEDGIQALAQAGLTDEILEEVMEKVVAKIGPIREIEVDLAPALLMSPNDLATMGDLDTMYLTLGANSHLKNQSQLLVANIRNTGTLAVTVEGVELEVELGDPENPAKFALMGRNDFWVANPRLPYRLDDGAAVRWLTKMETTTGIIDVVRANGFNVVGIRSVVRLGTGETVTSRVLAWSDPV